MGAQRSMDDGIRALTDLLRAAERVLVFTGAGVSTESGIPDFRSPGGIWDRYPVVYYDEFLRDPEAQRRYWLRSRETYPVLARAQPNPAHWAIAALDALGKLLLVVTQNIDGLHQRAGTPPEKVVELHGNNQWVVCVDCDARTPREAIQAELLAGVEVPRCARCGGLLKNATVSFGQPLPAEALRAAEAAARTCDLCLVVGSSLVVYPAAYIPLYAVESGAPLAIVNATPTPLDPLAQVVLRGRAGEILPAAVAALP
ncbi:MAG TPA: Sir2 family NAD-dependent protein deacetylase [Chloroflexota bacterium]|nr:Sir2 family NAD-dependent protein deacetylase [Chloroflexota bacterium]HZU04585.1 Sir2 family NAD-dependent protein deacetylase [Chloroflexota bacterium]